MGETKAQSRFTSESVEYKYLIIILNSKTLHPKLKVKKTKLPQLESDATDTGKRNTSKTRQRSTSNSRNSKRNAELTRKENSRLFLFLHKHHAFALFLKLGIKILSFYRYSEALNSRMCSSTTISIFLVFAVFCCCR